MTKEPLRVWRLGERLCLVDAAGKSKDATVVLASPNGKSLAVKFDGFFNPRGGVGGFALLMPLWWSGDSFESFDAEGYGQGAVKVEAR